MAEGFLKSFDPRLEVYSAGTNPAREVNPNTLIVMSEIGIDLSAHYPKDVSNFFDKPFDYIVTVCDNAKESCPVFIGEVKNSFHIGFEDPADATGTKDEILNEYRRIRDEIKTSFLEFYDKHLLNKL
jgi:arsenate reductase